jgi:hypothetical protein
MNVVPHAADAPLSVTVRADDASGKRYITLLPEQVSSTISVSPEDKS